MTTTLPPSGDTPAELAEHLASGARLVEAFHLMPGVARAMREAASLLRKPCTCHPDDNPPVPCPQKFALQECRAAAPSGWKLVPVEPTMGMYDDWNAARQNGPSDGFFGTWIAAYQAMLAAAPAPAPAAPAPEPVAWIEHHKAGDNLLWDEPGGKKTPLYAHAAPVAAPEWQPVPPRARIKPTHEAADAFWKYWRENGETHKHGYYESTWGAINAALAHGWTAPVAAPAPAQSNTTDSIMALADKALQMQRHYCEGNATSEGREDARELLRAAVERVIADGRDLAIDLWAMQERAERAEREREQFKRERDTQWTRAATAEDALKRAERELEEWKDAADDMAGPVASFRKQRDEARHALSMQPHVAQAGAEATRQLDEAIALLTEARICVRRNEHGRLLARIDGLLDNPARKAGYSMLAKTNQPAPKG